MLMGEKSSNTKRYHIIPHKFCYFPINQKSEIVFGTVQDRMLLCGTLGGSLLSAPSGGSLSRRQPLPLRGTA